MIIKSDYRIASATDGYGILLRNKQLNDAEHRLHGRSVLFVHGATYGSSSTFDYSLDGGSWMDAMANAGFDAWCLDLLGYGESDRPDAMSMPPADNPPLVDTEHAVEEVNRAVDFILAHREMTSISLVGYSWGSAICGRYAGRFPDKVEKLVLSGALWVEKSESASFEMPGAYRTVDAEAMAKRWATGLTQEQLDAIVSPDVVAEWCRATVACDPNNDGKLRAPTGVIKDFLHAATTGEPWYDPGLIQAPTQIVVGEHDVETTPAQGQRIFELLPSCIDRRFTVVGQGTHSLLLENNRQALYDVVGNFLA